VPTDLSLIYLPFASDFPQPKQQLNFWDFESGFSLHEKSFDCGEDNLQLNTEISHLSKKFGWNLTV